MFIILCLKLCKNTIALHRKNYENGFKKFYISNIFKKRKCLKNKKYKYAHIVLAIAISPEIVQWKNGMSKIYNSV